MHADFSILPFTYLGRRVWTPWEHPISLHKFEIFKTHEFKATISHNAIYSKNKDDNYFEMLKYFLSDSGHYFLNYEIIKL